MECLGKFQPLHPPNVADLLVAPGFAVPRRPDPIPASANNGRFRDFYAPECILGEWKASGGDDHIAFIDKAFPHSRYDLMALVSNDDIRCSPCDVSEEALSIILASVEEFVDYVGHPTSIRTYGLSGSRVTIGINHDRFTVDRQNGQYFDKRFHLHLNCWPKSDLAHLDPKPLATIDDYNQRQSMVDPIAFLGPAVLYEALGAADANDALAGAHILPPDGSDMRNGLPLGLKIRLPGWNYLSTRECVDLVRTLHDAAESAYRDLHLAFTDEIPSGKAWYRPGLLDEHEVAGNLRGTKYLTDPTRDRLLHLRRTLSNVTPEWMSAYRHDPDLAATKLSLAGLDYHMGIFSPDENSERRPLRDSREIYLYMQFKFLNRHGGGPALGNAITVQIDRSLGPILSSSELDLRRRFAEDFVQARLEQLRR